MFSFPLVQAEPHGKSGHVLVYFLCPEDGLSVDARSVEITKLLKAWGSGDEAALGQLAEHVYPELRMMARRYMKNEGEGNTLQATALVHEVYLRLVDVTKVEWQQGAQFFAMAAQMMRRILVDAARARGSRKRGGMTPKVNIDKTAVLSPAPDRSILALDEAFLFTQAAEITQFHHLRLARSHLRERHAAREASAGERAVLLEGADPQLRRELSRCSRSRPAACFWIGPR